MIPRVPRDKGLSWASDSRTRPARGAIALCRLTGRRFEVFHVGRLIWLHCELEGFRFETLESFDERYQRKQLELFSA